MTQSKRKELFCPAKSVVLNGVENEIPVILIQGSQPNPLINKHQKVKGLNFENKFTQMSFYINFNTYVLVMSRTRFRVNPHSIFV